MRVEIFFEKFDQLADAPNAVIRMRELVLQWAVQGRLVRQDPTDEPAGALLERISSTAKTRRRDSDEPDAFDAPFQIPEGWEWVRLPRVLKKLTDGTHHSPPNGPSGDFMYVTAKNIKTDGVLLDGITYVTKQVHEEIYSRCDPSPGDVLYIKDGATTGITTINQVEEPFSMLSSVALLKPSGAIFNRYLLWAMRSPFFYAETRGAMKGAAITRVTLSVMAASLLPLPPLAEQKRIVAKVDELMALCDRLEAQQQERETRHAALACASLARFADAPTPANLILLFHPAYTILPSDLRKSILALAVQGKLVPQDPNDEPAEDWLRTIDKAKPNEGGEIGEPPFSLPAGWVWLRVASVFEVAGGIQKTPHRTPRNNAFPYLGVGNVYRGRLDLTNVKEFELEPGELDRRRLEAGDLLVIEGNGSFNEIGRCAKWNGEIENCVHQNHVIRCRPADARISDFVLLFLNSPNGMEIMQRLAITSSGLYNLSVGKIRRIEIPVPPLAEQRRIVAKVDQLMTLVNALETQLTTAHTIAENLMEAVVAELTTQD